MNVASELDVVKVAAGRLWACERWPYLASGLLALDIIAAPGLGTFAVDIRWHVYLDPEIVEQWATSQIGIVLNHELQHLLRGHADRARAIGVSLDDRRAWNVAADAEINDDLFAEFGRDERGLQPVLPSKLGLPAGRLAEHYFEHLDRHGRARTLLAVAGEEGSGVDALSRAWEDACDAGLGCREAALLRKSIALAVGDHIRSGGRVPGGLRRWAETGIGVAVDWRSELAAITRARAAMRRGLKDYSYGHLSRRGSESGVIFPGMTSSHIEVAVVVDTSASVTDGALSRAATEVVGIARVCSAHGGPLQLVPCDAAAARPRRIFPRATKVLDLEGGGGTDMAAGIEACLALRPRPDVVIVITDGETPWPDVPPPIPVIVALLDRGWAPPAPTWAHSVRIPLHDEA